MKHNIGKIYSGIGTYCSKLLPYYIHGVFNSYILSEQRAHFFSDPSSDVAPSMIVCIIKGLTKRLTISLDTTAGRVVWQYHSSSDWLCATESVVNILGRRFERSQNSAKSLLKDVRHAGYSR